MKQQKLVSISHHQIELMEYVHPRGADIALERNRTGVGRWMFIADDIYAEVNPPKGLSLKFKAGEPIAIEAGLNKGGYTIYFTDPDGVTLELLQPPP